MMRAGIVLFIGISLTAFASAGDWPQFRGPRMAGISDETDLPEHWSSGENIRWTAALPGRGVSSPVVVGDRLFVTACSGLSQTRLHVLCFSVDTGAKLWERQFWATGPTNCHPKTCMAAPTPTADRQSVFAFFATGDLVCLDRAGNLRWLRSLLLECPAMSNLVGRGASPVLHDGVLIVPMENQGESYLFGVNAETGRTRWRAERPLANNYTTPLLVHHADRTVLAVQAQGGLTGYDPASGTKLWEFDDDGLSSIASPVSADDLILGIGREMVALRPAASGPPELVWRSARLSSGTATPLAADGRVYTIKDGGVLECGDVRNGKQLWSHRLHGTYSASPVLAGGKLYLLNEEGDTTVLRASNPPDLIGTNRIGDTMLATPAVAHGCIFLRSDARLYCVGRTDARH